MKTESAASGKPSNGARGLTRAVRFIAYALVGLLVGWAAGRYRAGVSETGPAAALREARQLYAAGRAEAALRRLAALARDQRWGAEAVFWMGRIRWEQGYWAEAESYWWEVLNRRPDYAEAVWALLRLYERELRVEDSERLVLKAWPYEPDLVNRQMLLFQVLVQQYEEPAVESLAKELQRVVRIEPTNPYAVDALAYCYARLGRGADALALLMEHLERMPSSAVWRLQLRLAEVLLESGRAQQVQELLEGLMLQDDPAAQARRAWLHGRSWEMNGAPKRALKAYREAVRLAPAEYRYRFALARCLRLLGDEQEALEQERLVALYRRARLELVRLFRKVYARRGPSPLDCKRIADAYRRLHKDALAALWEELSAQLRTPDAFSARTGDNG